MDIRADATPLGYRSVSLPSRLDRRSVGAVHAQLLEQVGEGVRLSLDATLVTGFDTTGLQALAVWSQLQPPPLLIGVSESMAAEMDALGLSRASLGYTQREDDGAHPRS